MPEQCRQSGHGGAAANAARPHMQVAFSASPLQTCACACVRACVHGRLLMPALALALLLAPQEVEVGAFAADLQPWMAAHGFQGHYLARQFGESVQVGLLAAGAAREGRGRGGAQEG